MLTEEPKRFNSQAIDSFAYYCRNTVCNNTGDGNESILRFFPRSFSYKVSDTGKGTFVYLYGSTPAGSTVAVRVTGYEPYMFVRAFDASEHEIERFVEHLNKCLLVVSIQFANGSIGRAVRESCLKHGVQPILGYEVIDAISLKSSSSDRGFNGNSAERFIKITMYAPSLVKVTRDILEASFNWRSVEDDVCTRLLEAIRYKRSAATEPDKKSEAKRKTLDEIAQTMASLTLVDDDNQPNPWTDPNVDVESEDDDEEEVVELDTFKTKLSKRIIRDVIESSGKNPSRALRLHDTDQVQVYEADIDFVIRYAIDAGFRAEECVEVLTTQPAAFHDNLLNEQPRLSNLEFSCHWQEIRRASDEHQNFIPPQVCLSFDCEMELGIDGRFPEPQTERALQICCVVFDPVSDPKCERVVKVAFVLGEIVCEEGVYIYAFRDEHAMYSAFSRFVLTLQPDMMTGWNIEGFDLNYLIQRAVIIGCNNFSSLCREPNAKTRVAERAFQSSAHGTHLYKEVKGEGLFVWDLYQEFKRSTSFKLRSYSLEYVSNTFLGDRKEDVSYSQINTLQSTPEGRAKLMRYCVKDALLPARIIGKLALLIEKIELCRATGVPMDMICRRGLQVRLKSMLYREARYEPTRYVFYTRTNADRKREHGSYEGAYVHPPKVGYHKQCIIVLDYKSLYPSIIRTKNECVSTLIPGRAKETRQKEYSLTDDDMWYSDRNCIEGTAEDQPLFVRSTTLEGLVPRILQRLLNLRVKVKELMKNTGDDVLLYQIYNKRQLAIKLNCNSIYGVFGAPSSFAYCREIAASVTATGRDMILETINFIENRYTRENGYSFNAKTIYGDTDSVFVQLSGETIDVQSTSHHGEEMANAVTQFFKNKYGERSDNIIELEFEKCYPKLIMYAKKRYAGIKWEWSKKANAMVRGSSVSVSGMETERRDSCLLVSQAAKTVLDLLLSENINAVELVRSFVVNDLIGAFDAGEVPWTKLIQSKQFRQRAAEYEAKGRAAPIHIQLAAILEARHAKGEQTTTYRPGDRIQYVVIKSHLPDQKTSSCGEDPDYAWKNSLSLNREHYIEKGLYPVMMRILEPVIASGSMTAEDVVRKKKLKNAFLQLIHAKSPNRRFRLPDQRKETNAPKRGLMRLAVAKRTRCELCDVPSNNRVCDAHSDEERVTYETNIAEVSTTLSSNRTSLWQICQACVNGNWRAEDDPERVAREIPPVPDIESLEELTQCNNSSCEVYWSRRMNDRLRRV